MDRQQFETLRDFPGKEIDQDIRYTPVRRGAPVSSFRVPINVEGQPGVVLTLDGSYHSETGYTKLNVYLKGVGPICRLEANGPNHPGAGRHHKHALQEETCPSRNLQQAVQTRNDLIGKSAREIFDDFCERARIRFSGVFIDP